MTAAAPPRNAARNGFHHGLDNGLHDGLQNGFRADGRRNPALPSFRQLALLLALWAAFWAALTAMLVLATALPATAAEPLDLAELGRRGLGQRSRDVIVAQALTRRARPPLEIGLVLDLAAYGGDDLARAYLEMDAATNQAAESPLPPGSIRNLMASGMPPADIIDLVEAAAPRGDEAAAVPPAFAAAAAVLMETAGVNAQRPTEAPAAPAPPDAPSKSSADRTAAARSPQVPSAQAAPSPDAPAWTGDGAVRPPARPSAAELRRVPQTLIPGQPADPARPMPEAPGPYWTRTPQANGFFMGVHDEVKDDGHRYEIHANGRTGGMGQEVLSRASGRKVVRHHNGRTGSRRLDGPAAPAAPDFDDSWVRRDDGLYGGIDGRY